LKVSVIIKKTGDQMKAILKTVLKPLLTWIFKVEVQGMDNYHKAGQRVLIIANHTSFLDPLLLGVFLPDDVTFAINTHIAKNRLIKLFLGLAQVFVMDHTNPLSVKSLVNFLKTDKKTVIFPEGRITVTGSLMKIYDGTGMIANKTQAAVLPIRLAGSQYSYFSRLKKTHRLKLFPKITIHIQPHSFITPPSNLKGRARHTYSSQQITALMTRMMFASSRYQQTIFSSLLEARRRHGGRHLIVEDNDRQPLNYNALITRTFIVGNLLKKLTNETEKTGILLPNSTKTLNVILGLQLYNRIPAMINFSMGSAGMVSVCKTAMIKTVVTSRRFISLANLEADLETLRSSVQIIFLEDLVENLTFTDKIFALYQCHFAQAIYNKITPQATDQAIVLFTSGSEARPKGVVLSHQNILANHNQLTAVVSFTPQDIVLNVLPMFHSFSFTIGTLLPVLNGMKTFLYPTPLHFNIIPEISYELNATVLFGTNTFLSAYGQAAHPYDFQSIRYIFAGAEALQKNTRELWADKFGIRIFEGYGATETSPVLSVNSPTHYQAGSVGQFLPGIDYQLESIPGISTGQQLHVSGSNIMLGYLLPDTPGKLIPPTSIYGPGWYNTGDIVTINENGFLTICGRSKRFAKIGGEMVSLAVVEKLATTTWPNSQHAATTVPDIKKGEQIILITTEKKATVKTLTSTLKDQGLSTLNLPKTILFKHEIPTLATGKTDYPSVAKLASTAVTNQE